MSAPGGFILRLRETRGWERRALAGQTGISVERQQEIEEGAAAPTTAERRAYAKAFGFATVCDFDDGWRTRTIQLSRGDTHGRIPVVGLAPAGYARYHDEVYPDSGIGQAYIDPPPGLFEPNLFAFVIVGDSMEPDYPCGHFAICRPTPAHEISDGTPAFVRLGAAHHHACTFKRCFSVNPPHLELRAINPAYLPIQVAKADVDRLAPVIACVSPDRTSVDREFRYCVGDG